MLLLSHHGQILLDIVQIRFGLRALLLQTCQQRIGVPVVPAEGFQTLQTVLQTGQKLTDGVDVVRLAFQRHKDKNILAVVDAQQKQKRQPKGTQHQINTLHQRQVEGMFHRGRSFPRGAVFAPL